MNKTLYEGSGFRVSRQIVGQLETNSYLVFSADNALVVDPGGSPDVILAALEEGRVEPSLILLTHAHADHIGAVGDLKERFPRAQVYLHTVEADWPSHPANSLTYWLPDVTPCPPPDALLNEGDEIGVGEALFRVLHLPGHTPGSVGFYEEEAGVLLSGDVLFAGSIGRTDLPGSSEADMDASLARLKTLPDSTVILPGHGPQTTLADEKLHNPFLTGGFY